MVLSLRSGAVFSGMMILFSASCGGSFEPDSTAGISSVGDDGASVSDEVVGGNVSEVSLSTDGATLDLSDIGADEDVLLVLYSFNAGSAVEGFQLSSLNEAPAVPVYPDESVTPLLMTGGEPDLTEEFHDQLRARESSLTGNPASPPAGSVRFAVAETGSARTFHVLNSFTGESYDEVSATLRYQNDDFQLYVDDRDVASLSDEELLELAENFSGVIPAERAMFGTESDVDGDGKFAVLFTHAVNELGSSSGGIVTGFFYAVDLFAVADYPNSNEMEVYFTFVPDPTGEFGATISQSFALGNILPGVLPHEYQHMISFNRHYFLNGGSAETGWLNEGLSHLAEDIYTLDDSGYMTVSGPENPARAATYLENIANICFSCGSSLSQRGGSYLFLRYLYEQAEKGYLPGAASGAEFITNLLDTNLRGVGNITNAAFGTQGTDADFKQRLGLFALALYLSNTGQSVNEQFNFDGVNLRAVQDDNRGTVLSGPAIQTITGFPFTDTLSGNGITYLQVSGAVLKSAGGGLTINVDSGADFGGYVVR